VDEEHMARDVFIRLNRCQYCNRPGFVVWDADLFTCDREICKTLAFAELHRRSHSGLAPEVQLARALLHAFDRFAATVHRDVEGELFDERVAAELIDHEQRETGRVLAQVHAMARRYPPTAPVAAAHRSSTPRFPRVARRSRTAPLHREPRAA
jgi:hypothetical protein